jgi:primosomal replication protein N
MMRCRVCSGKCRLSHGGSIAFAGACCSIWCSVEVRVVGEDDVYLVEGVFFARNIRLVD